MFLLRRIVGMASSRTARNIAFIAVTMIILIAAPLYGGDAENRHRGARQRCKAGPTAGCLNRTRQKPPPDRFSTCHTGKRAPASRGFFRFLSLYQYSVQRYVVQISASIEYRRRSQGLHPGVGLFEDLICFLANLCSARVILIG